MLHGPEDLAAAVADSDITVWLWVDAFHRPGEFTELLKRMWPQKQIYNALYAQSPMYSLIRKQPQMSVASAAIYKRKGR